MGQEVGIQRKQHTIYYINFVQLMSLLKKNRKITLSYALLTKQHDPQHFSIILGVM